MKARRSTSARGSGFSVHLGLPGLVAVAVLVVVGMAWSFILGVVVGRGHHPERVVEEAVRQALPSQDNASNATVLRPEELQFFEKLHHLPTAEAPAAKEARNAAANATAAKAATKAKGEGNATATKNQTAAAAKPVPLAVPQPQTLFEYQLAALDNAADAEAMVRRLKAAGLDASVSKGTSQGKTWHRVLVRHRGTVDSATEFKERLKKSGFQEIVLRSKQPLDTPKN